MSGPGSQVKPPANAASATVPEGGRAADHVPFPEGALEGSLIARLGVVTERHGPRLALVTPEGDWTYDRLWERVRRAAAGITGAVGDVRGQPVAVLAEHSAEQVLAVLAVMAAGGIVTVLDAQAPPELLAAVVADARPVALVHDRAHAADAAAWAAPGPHLALDALEGSAPLADVGPSDPAMLAYTSGTTGAPKAAVVSHGALLHLARGAVGALGLGPSDRLPMLFPVSLAVAAYPMLLPLLAGAALCPFDLRREGLAPLPAFLAEAGVTVLYFSPTVARFLAEGGPSHATPSSLRLVVLGGERVDAGAVDAVRRAFGEHLTVANGYGSTETGVLTFWVAGPATVLDPGPLPVGWPIPGIDLSVVGADGRALETGSVGELQVSGRYLFDGYWRRPDATARVLRAGPDRADGSTTYRTGDLAHLDRSGCLHVAGRTDTEVKIRGHRIVPADVEQALLALDDVADAVVEARPDAMGTVRLVAWVVAAPEAQDVTAEAIRGALAQVASPAAVPRHLLLLDELPMLPNGKLDRQALPVPGTSRPLAASTYTSPRTPTERTLVSVWEEVLDVRPVGVDDAFFDLGGSSLDAARMLVRIEEDLGRFVPMAALLERRTISELAPVLDESADDGAAERSCVVAVARRDVLHRSESGQPARRLFFVHDLYGTAWTLRPLADALGAGVDLFGFESPLLSGPRSPYATLTDLAERYVTDLREVQPEGPYDLAGYSFGGVLAFEMARRLQALGAEVGFLGVVDVGPGYRGRHFDPNKVLDKPPMFVPGPLEDDVALRRKLRYVRELAARDRREALLHLSIITGLDRWTDPLLFRLDLRRTGRIAARHRTWYAWREHWRLARAHRWEGPPFRGELTLFWADESAATDATMGWAPFVDGAVTIVRVDAPHETMMQTGTVEQLAGPLRAALAPRPG